MDALNETSSNAIQLRNDERVSVLDDLRGEFADLQQFILRWNTAAKKHEITELFKNMGIDFETLKKEQNMQDTDDFDFICYLAFSRKPLTGSLSPEPNALKK